MLNLMRRIKNDPKKYLKRSDLLPKTKNSQTEKNSDSNHREVDFLTSYIDHSGYIIGVSVQTRRERMQAVIDRGDVAVLLRLAEGYPCACLGAMDGEPECFCVMNSKQIREQVSLAALKRGELVRLKTLES